MDIRVHTCLPACTGLGGRMEHLGAPQEHSGAQAAARLGR